MLAHTLFTLSVVCAPQEPARDEFTRTLHAILPAEAELEWRSVPWRAEFRAALAEANTLRKPVLLWAMNGHPLGQT